MNGVTADEAKRLIRARIEGPLQILADSLACFEQTTHGCLGPFTIESVAAAMVEAHNEPSSYNVSTLSQEIAGFLNKDRRIDNDESKGNGRRKNDVNDAASFLYRNEF